MSQSESASVAPRNHAKPRIARTKATNRLTPTSPGTFIRRSTPISIETIPVAASPSPERAPQQQVIGSVGNRQWHKSRFRGFSIRKCRHRQHQFGVQCHKSITRLLAPVRKLMRSQIIAPCNIRDPGAGLKTFRDNPRLHILRSATIIATWLNNIEPPDKSITTIYHPKSPVAAEGLLSEVSPIKNIRNQCGRDGAYFTIDICERKFVHANYPKFYKVLIFSKNVLNSLCKLIRQAVVKMLGQGAIFQCR
ncbi:hypothetical protein L614_000200003390 [Ochrobactrum sp. J50]|nr:hypothetical protein L614_000200003390 [Ochrobactrum sp. J50]